MDFLNLLQNAVIVDQDGDYCGYVRGFQVRGHRLTINVHLIDDDEGDDNGGSREDLPVIDKVVEFKPDIKLVEGTNG